MIARNRLAILAIAAVLVLGGALLLGSWRNTSPDEAAGTKVLPALAANMNDVSAIRIVTGGNQPFLTLQRAQDGRHWQVMEREGYRADFGKIREFIIKLSELEVLEVKTSNPANYAQIGVEDLDAPTATGKRIEIEGLEAPLALIVGKSAGATASYVRLAGERVSYLARPQVLVYSDVSVWLDRTLPALADAEPAQEVTANADAGALAELSFEDVRKAAADEKWDSGVLRAQFSLSDGTVITALGRKEKNPESQGSWDAETHLVRFDASFDQARTTGEKARELNAQLAGWVYEMSAHQYSAIFRPLDERVEKD